MSNPLNDLQFPVRCAYPDCGEGPFNSAIEVDEHITEEHIAAAVWDFAYANMKEVDAC